MPPSLRPPQLRVGAVLVKAGANEALLTVGTYPVRGAFATTLGLAKRSDSLRCP